MLEYIKNVHGFEDQNITILMDDGTHTEPTYANIMAAYKKVVSESKEGDVVFCHYSGHGGKLRDDDGDEKDGYDETLVPVDYATANQIRDDDVFSTLVGPMARGVFMTCGESHCTMPYDCNCHIWPQCTHAWHFQLTFSFQFVVFRFLLRSHGLLSLGECAGFAVCVQGRWRK